MMSSMNPQINNQRENLNILNKNFMTLNNNKINTEKNFSIDISGNNQINENEDNLSDINNNNLEGENLYKKNIKYTLETLTDGKRDELFKKYETVETQQEDLDKKENNYDKNNFQNNLQNNFQNNNNNNNNIKIENTEDELENNNEENFINYMPNNNNENNNNKLMNNMFQRNLTETNLNKKNVEFQFTKATNYSDNKLNINTAPNQKNQFNETATINYLPRQNSSPIKLNNNISNYKYNNISIAESNSKNKINEEQNPSVNEMMYNYQKEIENLKQQIETLQSNTDVLKSKLQSEKIRYTQLIQMNEEKNKDNEMILNKIAEILQVNSIEQIFPKINELLFKLNSKEGNFNNEIIDENENKIRDELIQKLKGLYITLTDSSPNEVIEIKNLWRWIKNLIHTVKQLALEKEMMNNQNMRINNDEYKKFCIKLIQENYLQNLDELKAFINELLLRKNMMNENIEYNNNILINNQNNNNQYYKNQYQQNKNKNPYSH